MDNMNHPNASAFEACYTTYHKSDQERDGFVKHLLENYDSVSKKCAKLQAFYQNETENREMWQTTARQLKTELTQIKLSSESHPFVVVIVDGDGAKFTDSLFAQGDHGGGQAAQELKIQVKQHLQAAHPDTSVDNWNIIVQFYANMDGLAKTLHARGILSNWTELQKFASGFGRANSLFSFIDVGYGKDKADHKCREMLKVMLHVSSCRHVLFGPCADNGYLTLLEEYKHDIAIKKKLTLLETTRAEPGFVTLGFNRVSFPTVFRSEPLNTPNYKSPVYNTVNTGIYPFPAPTSSDSADDVSNGHLASPPTSNASTRSPPASNWAALAKSAAPMIDISAKKQVVPKKQRYVLLNAKNERVDERLPPNDPGAMKLLDAKARSNDRNFCNHYHLTGACDKGTYCEYQHDVKPPLSKAERLALWHKSRGTVCGEGMYCENPYCLNGHHCKNIYGGLICMWSSKCFFKDTHDADVKATMKIFEDGSREDLTLKASSNGR